MEKAEGPAVVTLGLRPYPGTLHQPMITIHFLPVVIDYTRYDAIAATSQNAITALEQLGSEWKKLPLYAVGNATAEAARSLGGDVLETTDAGGDVLAERIAARLRGRRVLYPCATETVSNLVAILERNGVEVESKELYETRCVAQEDIQPLPAESTIVFTSPKTVRCFFDCYAWKVDYRAVCIGETTKNALPVGIHAEIPVRPDLALAVELARESRPSC